MPRPSLCGSPSRLFHGSCALALFMHSKHSKINKNSWSLFAVNMSISFLRMPSARRSSSSSNNCRNSSLLATTQLFFFFFVGLQLVYQVFFPFLSSPTPPLSSNGKSKTLGRALFLFSVAAIVLWLCVITVNHKLSGLSISHGSFAIHPMR